MFKFLLKLIPALVIIAVTFFLSRYWLTHKPHAERVASKSIAPLVDVLIPPLLDHETTIEAMGTVIPAQSVNLTPRISGMVQKISPNFIEGGFLKKGEFLVELDPTDFRLAIKQSENELAKAQYNLKLELGQQAIARREYELLGTHLPEKERELVLRKPHLQAAKAAIAAAEANLRQAQLNLERTKPIAPFNAIIIQRNANVGAWMSAFSTGTPLARLVGTDSFWINVSISPDKLNWIAIPEINSQQGALVKVINEAGWGKDIYRAGQVKRLQAELEPEGRMAKVIVEVDDPLNQKTEHKGLPSLMLGAYVRVEIVGKTIKNVYQCPETVLRDAETVWLLQDQKLTLQKVTVLWREQGYVYIDSQTLPFEPVIITSDLAVPNSGMPLRIREQSHNDAAQLISNPPAQHIQ